MKNTIVDLRIILPDCTPLEAISVMKNQYGERVEIKDAMFTTRNEFTLEEDEEND